jgi:hypothetical protein
MMALRRVLRWLTSSYWLRIGVITYGLIAPIHLVTYAATGRWEGIASGWGLILFFGAGAALELSLRNDSAKAIMDPIAARIEKSTIWREFNKPQIANSVTVTGSVVMLMCAAMVAVMWAAMACIQYGFNGRALDAFLAVWPIFAVMAAFWALWLAFYHAGINPQRAFDRLFSAGAIGAVGFVAGITWAAYPELISHHQPGAQHDFHKAILSAPTPCVAAKDKLFDLSACTVFALRPGMTQSEVLGIVNGSGYFRNREKPSVCATADKCSHYVSFIKDGLYLRVEFNSDPKSAALAERVSSITFSLNEGANPYFDENQMMAAFLKLIGPNGSGDTTQMVWMDIKNALELRTYTYERTFWVVFSSRLADHPYPPGIPV